MRLSTMLRLLAAVLLGALTMPAAATVEAQLYADTYVVEDAGRVYSVLDVYAKGTHLGDTLGASVLALSSHALIFKTSEATASGDIFVHGGGADNGWRPVDDAATSWDSFIAAGNRAQGSRAKVTNRASTVIDHGVSAAWVGASGFSQMTIADSSFIDEGTASGWYSAKGGNAHSSAGASENPFARVSLYNAAWSGVYTDLYRGADVLLSKGPMQTGRTSAIGSAVLSGEAGASLDFLWMVGRFSIDITDRVGQTITMQVQFNMVGKNGSGSNNETGTTFSGTLATGSNPSYKVSRHFTFARVAVPLIAAISPSSGPVSGGTTITITGTDLSNGTVTVGGNAATVTASSATSITAVTPEGTPGPQAVIVSTGGGQATSPVPFAYVESPVVSSVTPSAGPVAGGTTIAVHGTNLSGATAVRVGGVVATGVVVAGDGLSLTAVTPAGSAGARDVSVSTTGGEASLAGGFTYVAVPTVTTVSPSVGPTSGNALLMITGTNFTSLGGTPTVTVGGLPASSVVVLNATTINANTPEGTLGTKSVAVTTVGGTATKSNAYTYLAPPTVTAVMPPSGSASGNTLITITGTNFTSAGGVQSVLVGGNACTNLVVVNSTTITAKTPAGAAGSQDVVVTTAGGSATVTNGYTYVSVPTVTGVSPVAGRLTAGVPVTITGTDLTGATAVRFGTALATGVVVSGDGLSLTAVAPAGTVGAKSVSVTTAGGTGTLSGGYTYVGIPTIVAVTPATGPTTGGNSITITGTNFTLVGGVPTVTMGGVSCTDVSLVSATTITAKAPAGVAGVKSVVVTTAGGTVTKASGYTHVAVPTVTGVTPVAGPVAGNTLITITGTNFTAVGGAPTVTVGGASCTSVVVSSATKITARTPAGTSGSKDVVVTTVGGTGTKSNGYTYAGVPTVSGVTPSSGPLAAGTSITITGTNFTSVGTAATVLVGGRLCTSVVVVNATTITAKAPAGTAGSKDVVVTTVGGTGTGSGAYTYVGAPTIGTVSPTSGPTSGGTVITITGTNLSTVTSVKVGGVACTGVTVVNATTIQATTPSSTVGAKAVVVTTTGGTATKAGGFTYTASLTGGMGAPKPRGSGAAEGGTASEAGVVDAMPEWEALVRSLPVASGRCVRWILEGVQESPSCEAVDCADAASWEPDESVADEMDWDDNGVSDLCQLRCGDLDLDGVIDFSDLAVLTGMYGLEPELGVGDLDGDGEIGNSDAAWLMGRIAAQSSDGSSADGG